MRLLASLLATSHAFSLRPSTPLRADVKRAVSMSVTDQQQNAVDDFKMITEGEATVRKAVGVGIGLATAAVYATSGMGFGTLSAGIFGAVSTYRTGAEYQ